MDNIKKLIMRADAGTRIGTGHVMRSLALAQAWQDAGGKAHFAAVELANGIDKRLQAEGITLHWLDAAPGSREDASQLAALARKMSADWVVIDGYGFDTIYQCIVKDTGRRLLAIDDYGHTGHYVADIVLNQNIYADELLYPSRTPNTYLLLGTQYVLMRSEFWSWRGWRRTISEVAHKVLLTMGGGDPDNVTSKVIAALEQVQVEGLDVIIVVGAGNPHIRELERTVKCSKIAMRLMQNVEDMPRLMAWADLVVSAGGSTCWELAFMGVPNIILVLADNQLRIASRLDEAGVAKNLGPYDQISSIDLGQSIAKNLELFVLRTEMSERGQALVDGYGSFRVIKSIQSFNNNGNSLA